MIHTTARPKTGRTADGPTALEARRPRGPVRRTLGLSYDSVPAGESHDQVPLRRLANRDSGHDLLGRRVDDGDRVADPLADVAVLPVGGEAEPVAAALHGDRVRLPGRVGG